MYYEIAYNMLILAIQITVLATLLDLGAQGLYNSLL